MAVSHERILYNENELIKAKPKIITNASNIMLSKSQTWKTVYNLITLF